MKTVNTSNIRIHRTVVSNLQAESVEFDGVVFFPESGKMAQISTGDDVVVAHVSKATYKDGTPMYSMEEVVCVTVGGEIIHTHERFEGMLADGTAYSLLAQMASNQLSEKEGATWS